MGVYGFDVPAAQVAKVLEALNLGTYRLYKSGLAPKKAADSEAVPGDLPPKKDLLTGDGAHEETKRDEVQHDAVVAALRARGVLLEPRAVHALLRCLVVAPRRFQRLGLCDVMAARAAYANGLDDDAAARLRAQHGPKILAAHSGGDGTKFPYAQGWLRWSKKGVLSVGP